jgi:putative addiction module component (TIGR02574 family)
MSQSLPVPPPGFDDLSIEDQIEYVTSLWDRIASDPEKVPIPGWHLETLRERLEAHRSDSADGVDWPTARKWVEKMLKSRTTS